jgi:hypothetical protein
MEVACGGMSIFRKFGGFRVKAFEGKTLES